jgi:hypothetical protein
LSVFEPNLATTDADSYGVASGVKRELGPKHASATQGQVNRRDFPLMFQDVSDDSPSLESHATFLLGEQPERGFSVERDAAAVSKQQ